MDKFKIKKIDLKKFIEQLVDIYDSGADYIDMEVIVKKDQDTVKIIVLDEYLSDEEEEEEQGDISEDYLNNLL
jgi:hypothetical protein